MKNNIAYTDSYSPQNNEKNVKKYTYLSFFPNFYCQERGVWGKIFKKVSLILLVYNIFFNV